MNESNESDQMGKSKESSLLTPPQKNLSLEEKIITSSTTNFTNYSIF